MKSLMLAVLLAAAGGANAAQPVVSTERMREDIKVLASDAFEGRGVASAAEPKVIGYISRQFAAAGLAPGGDTLPGGKRAWTQAVPLARFGVQGPMQIQMRAGGETLTYAQGEQVAIRAAQTGQTRVSLKDAPVIFAGYGVTAPERRWDDFKDVDVRGKVILVLVNDPDYETGQGDFGGKAMTWYGRWVYKYEEAARRGAAGVFVIHETAPAAYGWATVRNSNTAPLFDIVRADPAKAHAPVEAWITHEAAIDLFRRAGLDYEAQKKAAQSRDFRPVALNGVSFSADYGVQVQKVISHNVVGVLPGKARPNERVLYTAHWDHLGIGPADPKGDRIYNGAVDNGTGVAMLLELARNLAAGPRPQRSMVFLSVTAEEQGLLGSEYYGTHPLYPLAMTVADLNMDAFSPLGPTRDITTSGDAGLTLQDDLVALAAKRGVSFTPDPDPEAGHFYRSDHFPLAKQGVPAISVGSGRDFVEGGRAAGDAASQAYYRDHYHQPSDAFDPKWPLTGLAQQVSLLRDLGLQLANSREWPTWKPGSEFKAARDRTAAQRSAGK